MTKRRRAFATVTILAAGLLVVPSGSARQADAPQDGAVVAEDASSGRLSRGELTLAFLPLENLSGTVAPLKEIASAVGEHLRSRGVRLLDEEELRQFMARHRMRYTGGLAPEMGRAFSEEVGVGAVLVASVDLCDDGNPPKIALTARLVSAGEKTAIAWMDSVDLTGDQSFGFLGLRLVKDFEALRTQAAFEIAEKLEGYLAGDRSGARRSRAEWRAGRFRPRSFYRSPRESYEGRNLVRVAVLPFANESGRANAEALLGLQFVRELTVLDGIDVLEPGVVRQALLQSRLIQTDGLSLPQADLLRSLLDVDLVLTGRVTDYEDYVGSSGNPRVGFSVHGIDAGRRQVAWTSVSYGRGSDGVFFFEAGRIRTAHRLASRMASAVVGRIVDSRGTRGSKSVAARSRADGNE